jgi:hypothetical protein
MDVNPEAMGERAGTRSSIWAALQQPAGPWRVFLLTGLAWFIISVIVLRFALASVAAVGALVGVVFLLRAFGEFLIASAKSSLPLGRRLAGYVLAAVLAPLLTLSLAILGGQLNLTTDVGVFVVVAVVVSLLVDNAVRRTGQAARAMAESELLATTAASMLRGQEALAAVLDRAREAFGVESVTLLERGHGASSAIGGAAGVWAPVAVSGGPPLSRPDDAAVQVPVTGSLCLVLGGRALPATDRRSLGAFAAFAAAALGLALSRGLTEAMHGTLEPEETPGGGLTTAISMPAVPGQPGHALARLAGASGNGSDRPGAKPRSRRRPSMARCWGDSVPGAGEPQIPRTHAPCWPAVQCRSGCPGHVARAAGFDDGTLQAWLRPPGRQSRECHVAWAKEAGRETSHGPVG